MKRILITGASSGIGAALAKRAGASGWEVFVGYAQGRERAAEVVDEIRNHGGRSHALQLNLLDAPEIRSAIETLAAQIDSLDALVLCASPKLQLVSFLKTTPQMFEEQLRVNVIGNHVLMAEVWKRFFRPAKAGHLLAVLSAAALSPPGPNMSAYVLGKRALASLVESALAEFGNSGLRASLFSPDYTETPMLTSLDPRILEAAKARLQGGSFLHPEAVAAELFASLENPPGAGCFTTKNLLIQKAASNRP